METADPSLETSDLALTDAPVALSFDLYNNSSAQVIDYTTSSTGAVTVAESDYANFVVDETEKTITVTPTAVTPSAQTITVSQAADESYNAGSVTFTVTVTDSTPIPTYTVTLGDDNSTLTEAEGNAGVTLPSRETVAGYDFAGWSETNVSSETTTAPTIIPAGAYSPTANITLYPVYSKTEGGGGTTSKTASVTMSEYATANNWGSSSSANQKTVTIDENVTATCNDGTNSGKYYTDWRIYQSETGKINISTTNGELSSVTFTYTVSNTGTLNYNSSAITSGTPVSVSGTSAEFTVGNSGTATNGQVRVTAISVEYSISGGGTTYYWSAPVAAAVERPVITVADNPFTISTTATITCATDGATIKYSYDGETWNNYTAALTLNETTTIYAKAVKDNDESAVASVTATKNLAVPTVTIDDEGITNTDVYTGTDAGSLAASVTYNDAAVERASVTWSGNNDAVATINAETGAVTLVAAGTVTFTATYAGDSDYSEKAATYQMTVTNSDPNAPGSENNPYTVAQAIAAIDAGTGVTSVYVTGIVCTGGSSLTSGAMNYWISDDGTETDKFEIYKGKGISGAAFTATTDIKVGDVVVVTGNLTKYNTTYEFSAGSTLVSLSRQVETPTFSPKGGAVIAGTEVTISSATDGATIYYTTDGTTPTSESSVYSTPIVINAETTIKAFAVKEGNPDSEVATAEYTISLVPTIELSTNTIEAPAAGMTGTINVTYGNITEVTAEVIFCDAEGNTATYDWITAEINAENNVYYVIGENTSTTDERTAYLKVYALDDKANDVYSELITFTQAKFVIDYAELPFAFNKGVSTLESTTGFTQSGLGTDYSISSAPTTQLKFDTTDDYIILKINEKPGTLFFDIKGNSFSGSTFTVQTSTDGETYRNLQAYTKITDTQTEAIALASDVRYIKWIYTEKSNGNVGLGNISVSKPVDVTLNSEGYATFASTSALDFSDYETAAYSAWQVTGVSGSTLGFQQIQTAVAAGTGILLKGEDQATITLNATAKTGESLSNNKLVGVTEATAVEADAYFGLKGKEFVKVNAGTVPAGKAILPASVANGVKSLNFNFDGTGIEEIANGQAKNEAIYDLSGRRVEKPTKGLYIVNGKKVLY